MDTTQATQIETTEALTRGNRRAQRAVSIAVLTAAMWLNPPATWAAEDCIVNEFLKIDAPDGQEEDAFGVVVSLSGDVAVVGADQDDPHGRRSGSAYVYRFDGAQWLPEAEISPDDGSPSDSFGAALAVDGHVLIVGAKGDGDEGYYYSGSAYVFRYDPEDQRKWIVEAKLRPDDLEEEDSFGQSVAIFGDTIVASAIGDDAACPKDPECNSGAVYIFRYEPDTGEWLQEEKLILADGLPRDFFGSAVAVADDLLAVSTWRTPGQAVYVFRHTESGWALEAELPEPGESGRFGNSIAMTQDTIIVGKPYDNENGESAGAAYAYRFDGTQWRLESKLLASDGASHDRFGSAVAIVGNQAIVGAYYKRLDGQHAEGSVYVYARDAQRAQWEEVAILLASDRSNSDFLGRSVAASGDNMIFSSPNNHGHLAGAVYFFRGLETDCNRNNTPDIQDIAACASRDCNQNGVPDECDIDGGSSEDANENRVPDECECPTTALTKVVSTSRAEGDRFGHSVAVSDTRMIVGAPGDDRQGAEAGGVIAFERREGEWSEIGSLHVVGISPGDEFGYSVALSGDLLLVGAPFADAVGSDSGAMFAFQWDGSDWIQTQVITPIAGSPNDWFGFSMDISGDLAIVGAPQSPGRPGAAFVFRHDGDAWIQVAKLTVQNADEFGTSVSISEIRILVGAPGDDNGPAAFVFRQEESSWVLEDRIEINQDDQDKFGWAVSIERSVVVVGAPTTGHPEEDTGAAYVFRFNGSTWPMETRLSPLDQTELDLFGTSVFIADGLVFVGAEGRSDEAVSVFEKSGSDWLQVGLLSPPDSDGGFGSSLSVAGGTVAIGAPRNRDFGQNTGAAYAFELTDCDNDQLFDHCEAMGDGDFNADGRVDLADFGFFEDCMTGPHAWPDPEMPECAASCLAVFDSDLDGDVDLQDFTALMERFGESP